jgi:hypothetical protein
MAAFTITKKCQKRFYRVDWAFLYVSRDLLLGAFETASAPGINIRNMNSLDANKNVTGCH